MTPPWDSAFEPMLRPLLRSLPEDAPLLPDENLSAVGLDSMGSVELLLQLESTYAVEVPDELLLPSTFATPAGLWQVVCTLLAEQQG